LRFRTRDPQQSRTWHPVLLFSLTLLTLLPFSLLGARTRLLPSRLLASMMDSSYFSLFHPSSFPFFPQALGLFSHTLGSASTGFFYTRCSFATLNPWGASPFLFFPALSPVFSIFFSSISCPRVSSYSFPSPPIPVLLLASLHSLLLHLRQVAPCSVPCLFLPDIVCHYVSLCRSLIFLPPPSCLFPSATGEST